MGDNKISEANALVASLRQIADAQYTRRQRFNGRPPADAQEVLRIAADHLQGEAVPYGWVLSGPNGSMFCPVDRRDIMEATVRSEYIDCVQVYLHPQPAELNEVSGNSGELPPLPKGRFITDRYSGTSFLSYTAEQMQDYARAALAATGKQQVGEVQVDSFLGYVRTKAIKALREDDEVTGVMVHVDELADSVPVYLACRQPVGDEDRAEIFRKGWEAGNAAQGIDLGQFRRAVEDFTFRTFQGSEDRAYGDRLLALIDGRDAGTGVGL